MNTIDGIEARLVPGEGGCLVWPGTRYVGGYGQVSYRGRCWRVHRLLWESRRGAIPAGFEIDHLCRNRACANLDHLEPVTRSENVRRGRMPGILAERGRAQTHCLRGHPFTEANTYRQRTGARRCRACNRIVQKRYWDKKRREAELLGVSVKQLSNREWGRDDG